MLNTKYTKKFVPAIILNGAGKGCFAINSLDRKFITEFNPSSLNLMSIGDSKYLFQDESKILYKVFMNSHTFPTIKKDAYDRSFFISSSQGEKVPDHLEAFFKENGFIKR